MLYILAAAFAAFNPIRPEAAAIVCALHAWGVAVWLLSGDNVLTASAVAACVGICADRVVAGMLPTQKAAALERLRRGTEPIPTQGFVAHARLHKKSACVRPFRALLGKLGPPNGPCELASPQSPPYNSFC